MVATIIAFALEVLAYLLTSLMDIDSELDTVITAFLVVVCLICPIVLFMSLISSIKNLKYYYGNEGKEKHVTTLVLSIIGLVISAPYWVTFIISLIEFIIRLFK